MTSLIRFIFDQAWILFIVVTCINAVVWWRRGRNARLEDPSLEEGYRSLIKDFLLWANLPWIVLGVLILSGFVPSTLSLLESRSRNPYVLGWWVAVVATHVWSEHWILFQGGAEKLIRYPGLLNLRTSSPAVIKILSLLAFAGEVVAVCLLQFTSIWGP